MIEEVVVRVHRCYDQRRVIYELQLGEWRHARMFDEELLLATRGARPDQVIRYHLDRDARLLRLFHAQVREDRDF